MYVCLIFSMMKPCVVTHKLLFSQWHEYRHALCLGPVCKCSVTAVRIWTHQLCLMWHTPFTSMEKQCVSVRARQRRPGLHGTSCLSKSQWEFESEWDPAPGLYSPVIFNHPPLCLLQSFPPDHSGSTFGSFSCSHAARFKQNQRMIALRLSNPPVGKRRGEGRRGGERNV